MGHSDPRDWLTCLRIDLKEAPFDLVRRVFKLVVGSSRIAKEVLEVERQLVSDDPQEPGYLVVRPALGEEASDERSQIAARPVVARLGGDPIDDRSVVLIDQ